MANRCVLVAVATLGMVWAGVGHGQGSEGLRLSGYGTFGYVQDNRRDIVAIRDVSQRPEADHGRGSWQRDSRLGIQAEYQAGPTLDLVAQLVVRDQVSLDGAHSVESAYAAMKPSPVLDVRFGRVGYDAFLMSDTRNVGYAYPWVRPFIEYYGWIPLFSVDGADIAYLIPEGDAQWRLKAQLGHSRVGLPIGDGKLEFKTDNLLSVTASRRSGPWEAKFGLSAFTSRNEVLPEASGGGLAALQQGLDAIAAATAGIAPEISGEANDLRRQLSFKGARVQYVTFGLSFNDGDWLVQAELARTVASHALVPQGTMGYGVIGHRWGDWQPFVAVSATRPGNAARAAASDWSLVGQAATQATAIESLNSSRMDQTTFSIGTRWDVHTHAALKLQWDRMRIAPRGYGLLFKDRVLETTGSRMNQMSVAVDFLF